MDENTVKSELPAPSMSAERSRRWLSHTMDDAGASLYAPWGVLFIWRSLAGLSFFLFFPWSLRFGNWVLPATIFTCGVSFLCTAVCSLLHGLGKGRNMSALPNVVLLLHASAITFNAFLIPFLFHGFFYWLFNQYEEYTISIAYYHNVFLGVAGLAPLCAYSIDVLALQASFVLPFVYGIPSFVICSLVCLIYYIVLPSIDHLFGWRGFQFLAGYFFSTLLLIFLTLGATRLRCCCNHRRNN